MSNYYILSVNSLIKTFSVLDAGNTINFGLTTQDDATIFSQVVTGDYILGYVGNPIGKVKYVFDVSSVETSNQIELVKKIEVSEGASLEDENLERALMSSEMISITKEKFAEIMEQLLALNNEPFSDLGDEDSAQEEVDIDESTRLRGGRNILLYGVPGCGKSHSIKTKYCKDVFGMERVVFHPDYTYGDFVGQIMPITDEETQKIKYEFLPGPFTRILSAAYNNPTKKYCLIVEEINRGNAPAIFGDIFQLLDREDDGTGSYDITNVDVADRVYIHNRSFIEDPSKIKIPSNLYVFATMNTSDQNVFTLDTAFQRRWNMRMVENDVEHSKIANKKILDTNMKWSTFAKVINELVLAKNVGMTSSEDKRLGAYFVTEKDLYFYTTNDEGVVDQEDADDRNHNFPEKVLKYLWDDAFKFTRDEVFKTEFDSLEKLIKAFENAEGDQRFSIFMDDVFGMNQEE